MATFYFTNAVVSGMLNGTGLAEAIDAGTAAVIEIRSGSMPANADAAEVGTVLAVLTCAATAFSGFSDTGSAARATFAAITPDTSADATGTATHFYIRTQASGGAKIAMGDVGTSGTALVLNTTSITAGSQVSITSATIDLPEGP